jgi:hypothetical protein
MTAVGQIERQTQTPVVWVVRISSRVVSNPVTVRW